MEAYGVQCKDASQVLTVYFPSKGKGTATTTTKFNFKDKEVLDLSQYPIEAYMTYPLNQHHLTTKSHYDIILPLLAERIKTLPYNKDDFELVPFFAHDGKYDVSYLKPKKDFRFKIESKGRILDEHCDFMGLTNINEIHPDNLALDIKTEYHRIYRASHCCSVVTNETIDNDNKIFISGDSMDIPLVPVLAFYYKEVVMMDNREGTSRKNYYKDKVFDAVIFSCFENNNDNYTFVCNLR